MHTNQMKVDWESVNSTLLCNPTYSQTDQNRFKQILKQSSFLPAHVWLSTSGSTLSKWVGLSKEALLISAQAVNQHLESHSKDCWINCLPDFHVGGLSIWARAYLSGASVLDFKSECSIKWCENKFYDYVLEKRGTLTSLVPAQVYDLVKLGKTAPSSLRAILVGGGMLLESIYQNVLHKLLQLV
jgi:O-succinylbenzoic acid--CoA ligase